MRLLLLMMMMLLMILLRMLLLWMLLWNVLTGMTWSRMVLLMRLCARRPEHRSHEQGLLHLWWLRLWMDQLRLVLVLTRGNHDMRSATRISRHMDLWPCVILLLLETVVHHLRLRHHGELWCMLKGALSEPLCVLAVMW
jgi:hypothetical protein